MFRTFCMVLVSLFGFSGMPSAGAAEPEVVLTVEGELEGGKPVDFTMAELEALGSATIRTTTPWHDGVQTFEGVPMAALMKKVGANGSLLYVVALNDYSSEVPIADFEEHGVILAYKLNGEYMKVVDKGPLFVMYPFDDKEELSSELYYTRAVWQVRKITVE